jgi:hypothetical protein
MTVTVAIVLAMLPVTLVAITVPLSMAAVVPWAVFSLIAGLATPGIVLAGSPPRGLSGAEVVVQQVVNEIARDNRIGLFSLDGGNTASHQACAEQERLNQCAGFHESDSFCVGLMKQ